MKIAEKITEALKIKLKDVTLWCDSLNVLWWIRYQSLKLKPPYFTVGTTHIIRSLTFFEHILFSSNQIFLNFDSSVHRTRFQSSTVNSSCCFAHSRSGFLFGYSTKKPASVNHLFTIVSDIGSSWELFIIFVISGGVNGLFLLLVVAILLSSVAEVIC